MEATSDEENQNRNNTANNMNSNEAQSKPKRQMKTPFQLQTLERAYALEPYPTEASRAELSEKLGLSDRQLQMWFCHRRLKDKKEGQAKEAASKKPRNAVAEEFEDEARSEHGSHSGSGSRSGSSPLGYGQLPQVLSGNMGPMGRRSYESPQSIFELRVIASVEAQLGEPLRDDGPILGMEFDPLPPDAFGAPIAIVEHQKQSAYSYEEKVYEHRDAKSKKAAARAFHDHPFHQEKSSTRPDAYGRVGPPHFYDRPIDGPSSETSAFLHRTEPSSREYGEQGYVSHARVLSQQDKQERILSSPGDYDSVPRQITHNGDVLRMDRKRKGEEARITTDAEAHEKRIRKELEKQDILRRKREEQIRKEMERHDRERRKEEERLMRERQREVERLQREQRREIERREKFLQKESLRAEKRRQKEELRREKEAVRLKASIEKATARRIARESMELIEDDRLELMELAAASKGLPSIVSLDHDTLQNLESFRDLLSVFPPTSVQLRRPFAVQPWVDSEENIGNLLMVWRFLITFADVLQLWPFTLDEFVQAFHDYDSRLMGEIHIALVKLIIKDIEDVARTPSLGLGTNQNTAAGPEGGHPHIVEGAYAWGFDIRNWQRHLNPLTWPEILRQFALSAGFGPQLKKRSSEWSYSRENNEIKGCEDIVSTLRNGSAAVNAVAIMKGKGFSLSRRSRHRLTPGTVKFAVFHVLSLEGSKGLTILELADKIQKSGLRDLTRSKAPEASISAALSRDAALFERTAPCTYCVRPTFRKDPADAEKVLSAAREKVHVFENGFLAGEDVDDVERDDDSECDVAEGPEVDDLGTPSNANKNTIHLNNDGSTCSGNGKENACNDVINPQNEVVKDFSSPLSSGMKVTTTASITLNQYGAGNPDQENVEIDESNSGEPWVQGLAEGEYSDLSVEERLNALVALIGVANEGNTIRAVLEDRLEAAIALKKQMWAEAQLDKKRLKEENITKVQYTSCIASKADMKPTSAAAEGSQSPLPVDNKNNEASLNTAVGQKPSVSSHNVQNHLSTLPTEGTSIVQESTVPNNFISQHGYDAERSRLQLKSYIAHRAEDVYVYRSLPLGQDRRRNRYWQFVASASRNDPGSGRIFVELHDGYWRLINSEEAFDALITSLDTRGIRESHLHAMLQKIEMAFKENVRRNSECVDNVGQTRTTVKNENTETDSNPDCIAGFDSPNSTVCGLVSDALEPLSSFGIELGRNEMEKRATLKRYQDFQKWMWKECFNSEALCSMKYGKKRCAQLLSICDFCFECYFNEDNHCPSCHRTFGSFDNNVHFLEHVIQCENKKKTNPEDLHISDSSLPLGIRLLKALLAFIEVSIPLDALESFWMEGYQRETWGMKIQTSSSIEDLLQIVTLLEGVIKQDRLSTEFRTTKELLGSCTSSGNAVYDSAYTGSVPVLAWIPQTTAAVAVRLLELDASISYIHHDKSQCHDDKKELGEFRKFPSRYAPVKNAQEVEISGFPQDIHKKEENWTDLGNGRDSSRHGQRGRGRGRGRLHGEKWQRRVSSSRPHTGKHNARDNPNLNQRRGLQDRRTREQESQGQGCRRGPRTVRRRADKRAVKGTPLGHLGDMVRPKGKGESHRNLIGEGWGKFTMMQMDNADNHSSGDTVESDDNAPEMEHEHGSWGLGFDGVSGGQTGDLMEVSDEDAEGSEDDNGSEEEGDDDNSEDANMNECSDGLVNGVGNEDLGTEYATSEDYSD
ncbi:homeobox-DDT domain protein RLT1-like isoform X2 [Vitis riparia]|uniref:homeobox-DDT domain protein RLT1-like isoform X2 n=1 Tax=Vitis riparia TaxID=96939 RepID=UPI00155AFB7A|nr:homeobox-DDT domain protein RLT1-like isoform X2 [Vitis riparia]